VVDTGAQRYSVSFGAFHTEEAARARLDEVTAKGVTNAKLGPRQQVVQQTVLVIRDPQAGAVTRIRDLVASYPGSEAKVGSCDKP
jgi:hypothetical protein